MTPSAPRSVDHYLELLRAALAGEDKALQQDALYDAEEYLRAEIAQHPEKSEADVLELIASTYGAPEEVAAAYRTTEATVRAALAPPKRPVPQSALGRFFGVFADLRAYTSLFFMFLSLATGIIYFTVTVTGLAMSAGLMILIIGIPFFLVFLGLVRVLALAEGRLVEAVTGTRMPRRPMYAARGAPWYESIKEMLKDKHTWLTMIYMIFQLPLGIAYFTIAVAGISVGIGLMAGSLLQLTIDTGIASWDVHSDFPSWATPFAFLVGLVLLTAMMHLAKGIGVLHSHIARALLVRPAT
jgi:uncharacterized membrane protein